MMRFYCSFSSGYCFHDESETDFTAINALTGGTVEEEELGFALANLDDWVSHEVSAVQELKGFVACEHDLLRARLDIESSLSYPPEEVLLELLDRVERSLKLGLPRTRLLSFLLRAPLRRREAPRDAAKRALAGGFAAVGGLLESLAEYQPRLSRIVGHWLELPELLFDGFPGGRYRLWSVGSASGALLSLVEAENRTRLAQAQLLIDEPAPSGRFAVQRVFAALAERVFPAERSHRLASDATEAPDSARDGFRTRARPQSNQIQFERALKQIDAIVGLVQRGRDSRARKFLRQLVNAQTVDPDGSGHAVKSLCNIAKQCAAMFRTDFERECLDAAMEISPDDGWTLVQFGDHLKRIGEYDDAIKALDAATATGERTIAQSAIADVYAQKGEYDPSLAIYRTLLQEQDDPQIRTAMADVLRRSGRFDEAEREYESLERIYGTMHRSVAGRAEIDKRCGRLESAIARYRSVLQGVGLDPKSVSVYRIALAGLLKQTGELHEAFQIVDELAQEYPFWQQPRILRAAIEGLLGRPADALEMVPHIVPRAFGEWQQPYVRGLLLLLLERFDDARAELEENLNSSVVVGESRQILRLAAAVAFLQRRGGIDRASQLLAGLGELDDPYARYLADALRYHLAVANRDANASRDWEKSLHVLPRGYESVRHAVAAIRDGRLNDAIRFEVQALLMLDAA